MVEEKPLRRIRNLMFIPKTLTLKNFLSHANSFFNYDNLSLALVIGQCGSTIKSNGAGKSSFFIDGMLWALFGQYRYKTKDNVVKIGEDEAIAVFEFELNDKLYKIERLRNAKKGVSKTAFSIKNGEWKNISGNSVNETQNIIEQTIGFTYDIFVDSVLAKQGDLQSFTGKEQSRKKELLEEILQLKKFEKCEKIAKEKRDQYEDQLFKVEGMNEKWQQVKEEVDNLKKEFVSFEKDIVTYQEELEELKPKIEVANARIAKYQVAEKTRKELEYKISSKREELETLKEKIERTKNKLKSLSEEKERSEENIVQFKKDLKEYPDIEESILEEKKEEISRLEEVLNELKVQAAGIVAKADVEKERLEKIKSVSGNCPTCEQEVDEETKKSIVKQVEQSINSYREQHQKLKEEFKQKKEKKNKIEEEFNEQFKSFSKRAQLESVIESLSEGFPEKEERVAELTSSIKEYIIQKEKSEEEFEKAKLQLDELEEVSTSDLKEKLNELLLQQEEGNKKLQTIDRRKGQIEGELKRLETTQQELESKKDKEKEFRRELGYYKQLANAFSRNGIPSLILEKVAIEIEKEANKILREFATDAEIEIQTQRETTSGSIAEAFNIIVRDKIGERPFELFSGGEAVRIAFALRIALSKILASRSGTQLRFLIIDENLSALDEEGIENFMNMLTIIQKDFDKILVITHRQDLQQYFQQVIHVVKEEGGSKILA